MSITGKNKWDEIEFDLVNELITRKGYEKKLQKILIEEGFQADTAQIDISPELKLANEKAKSANECNEEIKGLKDELSRLKSDLATCFSQNGDNMMELDNMEYFDPMF